MNTTQLATALRTLLHHLDTGHLDTALTRIEGWTRGPIPGDTHDTPDTQTPTTDDRTADDRRAEAAAARLHAELLEHLTHATTATTRANRIIDLAHHDRPTTRPDTPTDYALAGWCRSCARDHGHLEPIATRGDGTPRYRDLCRRCGEWTADHGTHPPLEVLTIWHAGRRLTTTDYRRIMGRDPRATR